MMADARHHPDAEANAASNAASNAPSNAETASGKFTKQDASGSLGGTQATSLDRANPSSSPQPERRACWRPDCRVAHGDLSIVVMPSGLLRATCHAVAYPPGSREPAREARQYAIDDRTHGEAFRNVPQATQGSDRR